MDVEMEFTKVLVQKTFRVRRGITAAIPYSILVVLVRVSKTPVTSCCATRQSHYEYERHLEFFLSLYILESANWLMYY